jgi:hypothetical protein
MSDKARTDTICPLPIEVAEAILLERLNPILESLDGLPDHPLLLTLAERCYLQGLRDAQLSLPQLLEVLSQDPTPAE